MSKIRLPYCFEVICPHCGMANLVATSNAERLTIVECDIEDHPGCGNSFVVEAYAEIKVVDVFILNKAEVKL